MCLLNSAGQLTTSGLEDGRCTQELLSAKNYCANDEQGHER